MSEEARMAAADAPLIAQQAEQIARLTAQRDEAEKMIASMRSSYVRMREERQIHRHAHRWAKAWRSYAYLLRGRLARERARPTAPPRVFRLQIDTVRHALDQEPQSRIIEISQLAELLAELDQGHCLLLGGQHTKFASASGPLDLIIQHWPTPMHMLAAMAAMIMQRHEPELLQLFAPERSAEQAEA